MASIFYIAITMGLSKYKSKRNFKESPEPTGGKSDSEKLRFVVQKHKASHLHYDFRLEMEGVLKSWAVPKGPSTDPDVKRLAMIVEDHPYDYRNFEGIIPSGYGAGTVMVWDEGFYEPYDKKITGKEAQDKSLLKDLKSGKLKFVLKGKKLKGEWALIKAHGRGENGWLLFKINDKYASTEDVTVKKNKSVLSKKTIEQLEKSSKNFYGADTKEEKSKNVSSGSKKKKAKKSESKSEVKTENAEESEGNGSDVKTIISKAKKKKFPDSVSPMLATLIDKPFDQSGWIYEVKWDGYRALGFRNGKVANLKSRNDKSFNEKFYPVTQALKDWNVNAVVDGEIVVVKENGISDFSSLQNWRSEADGDIYYYVFDLLWYDGKDLTPLPLIERRTVLKSILPADGIIKLSNDFNESGTEFFAAAQKLGLEGIIAKKADSNYEIGNRSRDWLKIKANKRQEMVIGGFTRNDDSGKLFSSLLVGVFDKGKLIYTGKVGTGWNEKTQKEMMKQFKPLITKKIPFTETPDINKPSRFRPDPPHASATWLQPKLVCEVSFTEMTTDGVMRHPSFQGMRTDKKAIDVKKEKAIPVKKAVEAAKKSSAKKSPAKESKVKKSTAEKIVTPVSKKDRSTFLNPTDETQVRKINGHDLKFTNLSKVYWPKEKITKRDMLNYYYQVAPYILPYLKDRPQSMNRHPNGINGESFYFKDVTGTAPEWAELFKYKSPADGRLRHYLVAKDEASLLYMASLGCIEMNPWHSRVKTEDYPDWCIIDLDPAKNTFNQVIEAAQVTNDVLKSMGVEGYPKTSGSTGIHIYIPLGAKYTYEQSKEFARVVVKLVHQELPKFTSIERIVKARGGKMYLDFLQNRTQATVSAPYSLRPKPGATVSMPLHWDEVKKGLKMSDFTIFNALERIKSEGDIFKPVLGKGINLKKIVGI